MDTKTVGPFSALDSDVYRDGECYHALTARQLGRSANYLAANADGRILGKSWPIHDGMWHANYAGVGYRFSAFRWKPVTPPIPVRPTPFSRVARLRVRAAVEAGKTMYLWPAVWRAGGAPPQPPWTTAGSSNLLAMASAAGALATYPAAGSTYTFPLEPDATAVQLWASSLGEPYLVNNNSGVNTAAITGGDGRVIWSAGQDFSVIDGITPNPDREWTHADYYLGIVDAATGRFMQDYRRVRSFEYSAPLVPSGVMVDHAFTDPGYGFNWFLASGVKCALGAVAVYGDPPSDISAAPWGVPDQWFYVRQKNKAPFLREVARIQDLLYYGARRVLVSEPWIDPCRCGVFSSAYPATEHACYPVEFSRPGDRLAGTLCTVHMEGTGEARVQVVTSLTHGTRARTTDSGYVALALGSWADYPLAVPEYRMAAPGGGTFVTVRLDPDVDVALPATYEQKIVVKAQLRNTGLAWIRGVYVWEPAEGVPWQ